MENSGIVLINKPQGFTSFDVVAVMRGILHTKKVGHTGTLDPMATGVLPILFGRATRLCDMMPSDTKRYTAVMKLGLSTDTYDVTGKVIKKSEVLCGGSELRAIIPEFSGEIMQRPPMYSAVKIGGKRLYDIARSGREVDRPERPVTVFSLELKGVDEKEKLYTLDISCSKGTYIRSIVHDMGERLGCGATLYSLCRTAACSFTLDMCHSIEDAREMEPESLYIPCDRALMCYPELKISAAQSKRFINGGELDVIRTRLKGGYTGFLRIYSEDGAFIGLGKTDDAGTVIKCSVLLL